MAYKNTLIIDVKKEVFKVNLDALKAVYKKNPFGFIEDYSIDFNDIILKGDVLKVRRRMNTLSPFRGVGKILGKLEKDTNTNLVLEYEINLEFSIAYQLILISVFFVPWLMLVIMTSRTELIFFGLILGGIFYLIAWLFNKHQINSLNKYFKQVADKIQKGL